MLVLVVLLRLCCCAGRQRGFKAVIFLYASSSASCPSMIGSLHRGGRDVCAREMALETRVWVALWTGRSDRSMNGRNVGALMNVSGLRSYKLADKKLKVFCRRREQYMFTQQL